MSLIKSIKHSRGFTLIELVVTVSVVGVLASITFISYANFRQSALAAQLKSDLNGAATAMENARTFANAYPASIPSTFTPTQGDTLTGGSADGKIYCIDGSNSQDASLHYYVDQSLGNSGSQSGTCATRAIGSIKAQ